MSTHDLPLVYIVGDDATLRETLRRLLESVGLRALGFADADAFLIAYQADTPGCLLLDIRLSGRNNLTSQKYLREQGINVPVIIITAHGNVAMAVAAMKQGALDFIEKPFNDQLLLDCVHNALTEGKARRQTYARRKELQNRFNTLTPREQDVLRQVVDGFSNRKIAETLSLSRKTVEVHRAKVMQKMQADTLSQLIKMAIIIDIIKVFSEPATPDTSASARAGSGEKSCA